MVFNIIMENIVSNIYHYVSRDALDTLRQYLPPTCDLPPQLLQFIACPKPWETLASLDTHFKNVDTVKYSREAQVEGMLKTVATADMKNILRGSAETCADVEEVNSAVNEIPVVSLGPVLALKAPRLGLAAGPGNSGTLRIPVNYVGAGEAVRMLHRGIYEGNLAVLYDETHTIWALVVLVGWGMKDSSHHALVQTVHVLTRPETPGVHLDPHFARSRTCVCESDALIPSLYYSYSRASKLRATETNPTLVEEKRNVELVIILLNTSVYPNLLQNLISHPSRITLSKCIT